MARENPAESAALLARSGRLVGVHVNDTYGGGDDDIMVGSVHFWAMMEFLFTLDRIGYKDWITLEMVPTRESPVDACIQSIVTLRNYQRLLDKLDLKELLQAQQELDSVESQRIIQDLLA
jgi:xylose isomerase